MRNWIRRQVIWVQQNFDRIPGPLQTTIGFFLCFLGVIGGLLPVIQGWMFMIPGLMILSRRYTWAKRLLEWAKSKVPGQGPKAAPPPQGS